MTAWPGIEVDHDSVLEMLGELTTGGCRVCLPSLLSLPGQQFTCLEEDLPE